MSAAASAEGAHPVEGGIDAEHVDMVSMVNMLKEVQVMHAKMKAEMKEFLGARVQEEPLGGKRPQLEQQRGADLINRYWTPLITRDYRDDSTRKGRPKGGMNEKYFWEMKDVGNPRAFEKYVEKYFEYLRAWEDGELDADFSRGLVVEAFLAGMPQKHQVTKVARDVWGQMKTKKEIKTQEALQMIFNVILANRKASFEEERKRAVEALRNLTARENEGPRGLILRMMELAELTQSSPVLAHRRFITDAMVMEKLPEPFRKLVTGRRQNHDVAKQPPETMLCLDESGKKCPGCPTMCEYEGKMSCGVAWYEQLYYDAKEYREDIWPRASHGKPNGKKDRPTKDRPVKGYSKTKVAYNKIQVKDSVRAEALKTLHEKYGHSDLKGTESGPKTAEVDAEEVQILSRVGRACRGCLRPFDREQRPGHCRGRQHCAAEKSDKWKWKEFKSVVEEWYRAKPNRSDELEAACKTYVEKHSSSA